MVQIKSLEFSLEIIWPLAGTPCTYRKIASSNTSCLEAHIGFFRLLMKGIFGVLWPFHKKLTFQLVTRIRTRVHTVCYVSTPQLQSCYSPYTLWLLQPSAASWCTLAPCSVGSPRYSTLQTGTLLGRIWEMHKLHQSTIVSQVKKR